MGRELKKAPRPFAYPSEPHVRRHGPFGYRDYKSYRDWLRDDFSFRCVFCLNREQWGIAKGNWDIDHFVPQSIDPLSVLLYENLLYVCHSCNSLKSNHLVPDPCRVAFGKSIVVRDNGEIVSLNDDGEILIEMLRLDNKDYTRWRRLIICTIRSLAKKGDKETLTLWMGYPEDLPDLKVPKPRGNTKPEGVTDSFYARRMKGALPDMY